MGMMPMMPGTVEYIAIAIGPSLIYNYNFLILQESPCHRRDPVPTHDLVPLRQH